MSTKHETYYYGRGSSACAAVQIRPGNYARVFIGNGKTLEEGDSLLIARDELMRLSDFFKAIWHERGQDIRVSKLIDDPHDEIFTHSFDFNEIEKTGEKT